MHSFTRQSDSSTFYQCTWKQVAKVIWRWPYRIIAVGGLEPCRTPCSLDPHVSSHQNRTSVLHLFSSLCILNTTWQTDRCWNHQRIRLHLVHWMQPSNKKRKSSSSWAITWEASCLSKCLAMLTTSRSRRRHDGAILISFFTSKFINGPVFTS